jgi:hypothetical protein
MTDTNNKLPRETTPREIRSEIGAQWATAPRTAKELREDLAAGHELCGFTRKEARRMAGLEPDEKDEG